MSLQCTVWNVFEQKFGVFFGEFWIRRETLLYLMQRIFLYFYLSKKKKKIFIKNLIVLVLIAFFSIEKLLN